MWSDAFIFCLAGLFAVVLRWAFRTLPKEEWQMLAAVPMTKQGPDTWLGINLTYYGVLVAGSCVLSTAVALLMMGSVGIPGRFGLLIIAAILLVCFPAARIAAMIVEKRMHTFTIAGSSFLGIVVAPGIVWLAGLVLEPSPGVIIPTFPVLAALSVAYAMGEGFGRLACISFGCCYGKPLSKCHPLIQRAIGGYGFVFSGKTKKIAYESGLEGEPVIPIQAMTSGLFLAVGILGMLLYFRGCYALTLMLSITITQAWRIVSETLRSDYRGEGSWSAYQAMAALAILYSGVMYFIFPASADKPADLLQGLGILWNPAVIILLQVLFAVTFLWMGRSTVTSSKISFQIRPHTH